MVRRTGSALVRTLWENVAKPLAGEFPLLTGACMNHKIRKQVVKRKISRLCHASKPACVPTDDQSKDLIPHRVRRNTIIGLVVRNEKQAKRELKRLKKRNLLTLKTLIEPPLFRPRESSQMLRSGKSPEEIVYCEGSEDA